MVTTLDPIQMKIIVENAASRALKKINKDMKKLQKQSEKSSKSIAGFGNSLRKLAGFSIAGIGIARLADAMNEAANQASRFETAMTSLGIATDGLSESLLTTLRDAARGTVSDLALVDAANRALALGIDQNQLPELMEVSRARARAMGITVTQAFNDMAIGIGRQSRLILDNLGIILNLEKVNKEYADQIGKTVSELTEYEKKQALVTSIIASSVDIVAGQNKVLDSNQDKIEQMSAQWSNAKDIIGKQLLPLIISLSEEFLDNKDVIITLAEAFADIAPLIILVAKGAGFAAEAFGELVGNFTSVIKAFNDGKDTIEEITILIKNPFVGSLVIARRRMFELQDKFKESNSTLAEFKEQTGATAREMRLLTETLEVSTEEFDKARKEGQLWGEVLEDNNITLAEAKELINSGSASIQELEEKLSSLNASSEITFDFGFGELAKEVNGVVDGIERVTEAVEDLSDVTDAQLLKALFDDLQSDFDKQTNQVLVEVSKRLGTTVSEASRIVSSEARPANVADLILPESSITVQELARRLKTTVEKAREVAKAAGLTFFGDLGEERISIAGAGVQLEGVDESEKAREIIEQAENFSILKGDLNVKQDEQNDLLSKTRQFSQEISNLTANTVTNVEKRNKETVKFNELVIEQGPQVIGLLEDQADAAERSADAEERRASALAQSLSLIQQIGRAGRV